MTDHSHLSIPVPMALSLAWCALAAATGQPLPGTIAGTVLDASGAVVTDASVTLTDIASANRRAALSDGGGKFAFTALPPSTYRVAIAAKGFAPWASGPVNLHEGETYVLPSTVWQVAPISGTINVALSQHKVAAEQLKTEEKQRIYGILPNFKATYVPDAAPLTSGQKFQLAWATVIDPTTFLFSGAIAGYEQKRNNLRGYGQGTLGFAKRFGANYADAFSGEMLGTAIFPSLLHQDPRYFYKGTGSTLSRALYAVANTVVCKGDYGRWQPAYSGLLGDVASGALSNLYYPSNSRAGRVTATNTLIAYSLTAVANLYQEFLARELTPTAPRKVANGARLVPHEGTQVSLILTEDIAVPDTIDGKPVAFALAEDLRVDRVIVAKRGGKALGAYAVKAGGPPALELQISYLQVGDDRVPLRASARKNGETGVAFERSSNAATGIAIQSGTKLTVYVDRDVSLPALRQAGYLPLLRGDTRYSRKRTPSWFACSRVPPVISDLPRDRTGRPLATSSLKCLRS